MAGLVNGLVHPGIVNLKTSWEVIAVARWEATQTRRFTALEAVAVAVVGAGLWEAPVTGNRGIHQQVQRFTGDFSFHNIETVSENTSHKLAVCEPLNVTTNSTRVRRLPFDPINMLVDEVGLVQLQIC